MKRHAVLSVGTLTLLAAACAGRGSSDGSFKNGGGPGDSGGFGIHSPADSGEPSSAVLPQDGGGGGDDGDGGGASCLGSTTGFATAPYVDVVAKPGSCGASDIQAFLADCVDNTAQSSCDAWSSANFPSDAGPGTMCGNCLFAPQNSGAVWVDPGLLAQNYFFFLPNYAGCVQLSDPTNGAACGAALDNVTSCEDVACALCSDNASFGECSQAADMGPCLTYSSASQSSCEADSAAFQTCAPSETSMNIDDDYELIIQLLCGDASAVDGGSYGDGG